MSVVASKELQNMIGEEIDKADVESSTTGMFTEVGSSGLQYMGGHIYQEFLTHLQWPRAAKVYQEMESNDPVVGAVMYVCEQLIRRISWKIVKQGETPVDDEAKEFLEQCLNDMDRPWNDIIAEILSMLTYGFSWHEVVYKRREGDVRDPKKHSQYSDGRIGWRKIAGRSQATIEEWAIEDGEILAAIQTTMPDYQKRIIPYSKSLLFRTKFRYNNPEGRSLLRNAYRPWYFKKHIEEIEGIGIERDLAGLPVFTTPEGVDIWNPNDPNAVRLKNRAEQLVRNIRRDHNEGVVKPFGWELELLSTGSRRQFDTNQIVNRYDQRIAMTLLADIVLLGADKVGSYALADVKKSLMGVSLESILNSIADVFNRTAIPKLFKVNVFPGLVKYPKLVPGKVITPDIAELARYIQALAGSKMPLFPNVDLEEYFREMVGMPSIQSQTEEERAETLAALQERESNSQEQSHPTGTETDPNDGRMQNAGNIQQLGG